MKSRILRIFYIVTQSNTSQLIQLNWKPVQEELQCIYSSSLLKLSPQLKTEDCYPWIFSQRAKLIKWSEYVYSCVILSFLLLKSPDLMVIYNLDATLTLIVNHEIKNLEDLLKQSSITSQVIQLNWKPVQEELQWIYAILGFSHSAPNQLKTNLISNLKCQIITFVFCTTNGNVKKN